MSLKVWRTHVAAHIHAFLLNDCRNSQFSHLKKSSLPSNINSSHAGPPQHSSVSQKLFLTVIIPLQERNRRENIQSILGELVARASDCYRQFGPHPGSSVVSPSWLVPEGMEQSDLSPNQVSLVFSVCAELVTKTTDTSKH